MAEADQLNESKSQAIVELPVFSIPMVELVNNSSYFHTQNSLKDPWQRGTAIERHNGQISVSCVSKDIVHGLYSEPDNRDGDEGEDQQLQHCSLIVLAFRFDPINLDRRIKKVQTTVRFSAVNEDDDDPVVDKIEPDGWFPVHPTTQKETVTVGAVGKTGGNILGIEVGGELKREKVVEREVTNAGTVRGAIETLGRNWGGPNAASWTLMENTTDKSGVPTWFKSDPKDDPVLYKVNRGPTNRLHNYSKETVDDDGRHSLVNNLGRLQLQRPEFSDITLRTVWENAQKMT
ncbi:hypothetical protein F4678DRAFT_474312 [Xylaria arbuscula]|nr:hypothetical protein F4678DRAFT_474312 [Xylaria arbuscula]